MTYLSGDRGNKYQMLDYSLWRRSDAGTEEEL